MTMLRSVSRGKSALAAFSGWQAFAWVVSSGPSQQPTGLVPFGSLHAKPRPPKGTGCTGMLSQTYPPASSPGSAGWPVHRVHRPCKEATWDVCNLHADGTWEAPKAQHNPTHPFPSLLFTPGGYSCVGRWQSCYIHLLSPSCLVPHLSRFCLFITASLLWWVNINIYPSDNQGLPPPVFC